MKYLFISIVFFACVSKKDNILKVYDDRIAIIPLFTSKSVMRSRGQNIILFYTYNNKKTNKYFFEIKNEVCQFTNDSIEYTPDILKLKYERGSKSYSQELVTHVKILLAKMDELNIRDFKSDLSDVGIDLVIYLKKSRGFLVYLSNPKNVKLPYWINYLNPLQKLDSNWLCTTANGQY